MLIKEKSIICFANFVTERFLKIAYVWIFYFFVWHGFLAGQVSAVDHSKEWHSFHDTLQPLYNTVHYNTVLDITQFKDGSQKCIDYIEK